MNTFPTAKRILCYGDSNTYGRNPEEKAEKGIKTRFPTGVRWTTRLQDLLAEKFEVIEEGLGARTTDLDDPKAVGRNGKTYFLPCLQSHSPLDLVVIMLGTNDFKNKFQRLPEDIAQSLEGLIAIAHEQVPESKILIVSPIHIVGDHPMARDNYSTATEKSHQLAEELEKISVKTASFFLDLAKHLEPSPFDGLHIDEKDQGKVAEILSSTIQEIFSTT